MKKIHLYTIIILLSIFGSSPVFAQLKELKVSGEYMINKDDLLLKDLEIYADGNDCCGVETLDDISFGYDISTALYSHNLIKSARDKALNDWFNKQNNLIKEEIEKQLNQNFSNFSDAQTAFYKNLEKTNIGNNISVPRNKYINKVDLRVESRNKSIRNLKLLVLRENEIKTGIINNSSYAYLKFNDTPLNQITSLNQIATLRTAEIKVFGDRDWPYVEDSNILTKLREISSNNQAILNELKSLQINYYNSFDRWERLDLMQLYLNHVRTSYVLAYNPISPIDYGTSNFIENFAIQNRDGNIISPFHPNYIGALIAQMVSSGMPFQQAIGAANLYATKKRNEIIDEALALMSNEEFITFLESEEYYRGQMSESEITMFDAMPISDQVKYLNSAIVAINKTEELFPSQCERTNGKGDAFRHAYWNALATQSLGVNTTKLLTTKHEEMPSFYPFNYKEKEMDLFNNQIGRNIASQGSSNLIQDILSALNSGSLRYINNQASNCLATFSSQVIPTNQ